MPIASSCLFGSLLRGLAAAALLALVPALPAHAFDSDGDGVEDPIDNCPFAANASQLDQGGLGTGSPPNGVGDACECGDASGDGRITLNDSVVVQRSLLQPPTAVLTRPELCDVNGDGKCTIADATVLRRVLLSPPTASIVNACVPRVAPAPILNLTQPVHGTFFAPGVGGTCNVTFAGNVPNVDDPDLSLFVGAVDTPTPGSAFSTSVAITGPLQSTLVQATRLSTSATTRISRVVSCADSLAGGSPALSGLGIRVNDRAIDRLEPVLNTEIANQVGNIGAQIVALSPIIVDQCVVDASIGCAVNLDQVNISSASLGAFGIGLDSQANAVAVSAAANNLSVNYQAVLSNAPDCTGIVSATRVDLTGAFALSPLASNRRLIDVNLSSGPTVGFVGFNNNLTGVCGIAGIEQLINLFAEPEIQSTVHDEVVNALDDPDGGGAQDSPLADAAESALAGLSLNSTIGSALGVNLDAQFLSITEDAVGVTFRIDANVNPAGALDPASPQQTTSLRVPSTFPSYGANTPGGAPYGLALSIDPNVLNKLLRSETQKGTIKFDVTQLDFSLVPGGSGGTQTLTTTNLGTILPDFASVSPAENVRIEVRPTLAPAVLDPQDVPATEVVRAAGVSVDFVGVTSGRRFIRLAVDGNVDLSVAIAGNKIDVNVTNVSALQARLIDQNLGFVSQLTVDILMSIIAPLGNLQITQSLESFPLPTVLGLGIVPLQIQNDFNGNFLNLFLDLQ
jgi:hypothetical protein